MTAMSDALRRAVIRDERTTKDKRVARKATYSRDKLLRRITASPGHRMVKSWREQVEELNALIKTHGLHP